MANGFWIGLGIGLVTAWLLYWRISKMAARLGFSKESFRRDVLGKFTYEQLIHVSNEVAVELKSRQPPYVDGDEIDVFTGAESCRVRRP